MSKVIKISISGDGAAAIAAELEEVFRLRGSGIVITVRKARVRKPVDTGTLRLPLDDNE